MAQYTTDVVLGAAATDFADALDAYIEGVSTAAPGLSGTDLGDLGSKASNTPIATNRFAQMNSNTASLTGTNCTYFCTNLRNNDNSVSSPVDFTNATVHLGHDQAGTVEWLFPANWTNVNLFSETTEAVTLGIFGNGTGTVFPVFDADRHITTQGDEARARARPWNWNDVRLYGNGGAQMLLNGVVPDTSSFININFNPAPGRGMFGELPFLPFQDATWGQFYRPDFPLAGDNLWARLTGGMNRRQITWNDNWMIQPQWDIRNLDGQTAQVAVDARCNVYFINLRAPADATNLVLRGGQDVDTAASGSGTTTRGPWRAVNAYGWNPIINGGNNDIKYVWPSFGETAFNVETVPAAFTGGNVDGTAVVPAAFTSGSTEPAGFNGFFLIQSDSGFNESNLLADGDTVEQYTQRDIHIHSYATQVNTIDGQVFTDNFGREIQTVPGAHEINADLTWRQSQIIDEPVDPFLNGQALLTDFSNDITSVDHIYPTLKSVAYADESTSFNRFQMAATEGAIRFLRRVTFTTAGSTSIDASTGNFTVRLQETNVATNLVNTFNFLNILGENDVVDWGTRSRTFAGPITIIGGLHTNFPTNWANGLTFGAGTTNIDRPGAGTELDWRNVEIPDGSSVIIGGTTALSIAGLTLAEQGRVTGTNITFVQPLVENTVTIPAPVGGRLAVTQTIHAADGTSTTTELRAPTEFNGNQPTTFTIDDSVFTNLSATPDFISIYVKYASFIATGPNVVYQESAQNFNFNTDGSPITFAVPLPVADVLVSNAVNYPGASIATVDDGGTLWTEISGAVLTENPFQSQGLAIRTADTPEYFNQWYQGITTTDTTPILDFPSPGTVQWDATRIQFRSGDLSDLTVPAQGGGTAAVQLPLVQTGADWTAINVDIPNGVIIYGGQTPATNRGCGVELSFPTTLDASISLVARAARTGIESSSVGTQVGDMHNYLGNTANNPILTEPQGGFDRTDAAANYGQNIERT